MRRGAAPYVLLRMVAFRTVVGTVAAITFIAATVLCALAVYEARALQSAAERRLAAADTTVSVETNAGAPAQFAAQSAALRADADAALGTGSFTVAGAISTDQVALPSSTQADQQVVELAGLSGLGAHATLVTGRWPTAATGGGSSPMPVAVPSVVATRLHLTVGTVLSLSQTAGGPPVDIAVAGIYRPRSARDPYWHLSIDGAAGIGTTSASTTYGPVAVDPTAFTTGALTGTQSRWVVQPSVSSLAAGNPAATAQAITALTTKLQHSPAFTGPQVSSGLPALLASLDRARAVARSVLEGVALALLVFVVSALVIAARPLGAQRAPESYLLAVRGRSPGQAIRADLAEAALLAVCAAAAAAPVGAVLAAALGHHGQSAFAQAAAWTAAAGIAALCAAILVATAGRPLPTDLRHERTARAPRLAGAGRVGADLAALLLTIAASWQLRSLPLTSQSGASTLVNPLIAVTPTLALVTAALLALRLLPPLAALCDRLAARGRHLDGALTAWQISRRPKAQAGATLLLFLAVAAGTFAFCERATWQRSIADQGTFTAGAPVRLDIQDAGAVDGTVAALAADPSVQSVTPVIRTSTSSGGTALAMDASTAPDTVLLGADQYSAPPDSLWKQLRADTPSVPTLPARTTQLVVTATLAAANASPGPGPTGAQLIVTVEDGYGRFLDLPAQALPADARPHTLRFPLGSGGARAARLARLTLSYQAPTAQGPDEVLTVASAAVPLNLGSWTSVVQSPQLERVESDWQAGFGPEAQPPNLGTGPTGNDTSGWSQRFSPGFGQEPANAPSPTATATLVISPTAPSSLPALATVGYLKSTHLGIGSATGVSADQTTVPVHIVGSVAVFPTLAGTATDQSGGLIVDADALQYRLLDLGAPPMPVSGMWLRTATGTAPSALPDTVTATTADGAIADIQGDPDSQLARQGFAALGACAAVLGATALLASAAAARRERRGQEAVLAALGISPQRQALLHAAERVVLGIPLAAFGIGVGIALARLLLPYVILTESATAPVPAPVPVVAWQQALLIAAAVVLIPALGAATGALRRTDVPALLRVMEER